MTIQEEEKMNASIAEYRKEMDLGKTPIRDVRKNVEGLLSDVEDLLSDILNVEHQRTRSFRGKKMNALQARRTILPAVAEEFNMTPAEVLYRSNEARFVLPRQLAMMLMRELSWSSYPDIALFFGKHHTTVMYGVDKAKKLCAENPALQATVERIRKAVGINA